MEDKNFYHLLVNPYKVNRNKNIVKENNLENSLILLLKKLYPKYDINDNDKDIILNNIENILYNINKNNLINNLIDNVIEESINII